MCAMSDMSEYPVEGPAADEVEAEVEAEFAESVEAEEPASVGTTGNEAVDSVLADLEGLDDKPVEEHVAVFERAHEQLRSALDGPRDA